MCKHHWTLDQCFTLSNLSSSLLNKNIKYIKCITSVLEITTDLQLWGEKETRGVMYNQWENLSQPNGALSSKPESTASNCCGSDSHEHKPDNLKGEDTSFL